MFRKSLDIISTTRGQSEAKVYWQAIGSGGSRYTLHMETIKCEIKWKTRKFCCHLLFKYFLRFPSCSEKTLCFVDLQICRKDQRQCCCSTIFKVWLYKCRVSIFTIFHILNCDYVTVEFPSTWQLRLWSGFNSDLPLYERLLCCAFLHVNLSRVIWYWLYSVSRENEGGRVTNPHLASLTNGPNTHWLTG